MKLLKDLGITLLIVAAIIGGLLISPILAVIFGVVVIVGIGWLVYAILHDLDIEDDDDWPGLGGPK